LASRSHAGNPTVVRFCRSVGYDGLSDFKLRLAGGVTEGAPLTKLQPLLQGMENNLRNKRYA